MQSLAIAYNCTSLISKNFFGRWVGFDCNLKMEFRNLIIMKKLRFLLEYSEEIIKKIGQSCSSMHNVFLSILRVLRAPSIDNPTQFEKDSVGKVVQTFE